MTYLSNKKSISYTPNAIKRAEIALICSPFKLALFQAMGTKSVSVNEIANQTGYQQGYTKKILNETQVDIDSVWLIQVGLLRREVDGQGITDSFRLTPLGKEIIQKWPNIGDSLPTPSLLNHLFNFLNRWLRFPLFN